VSVYLCVSVRLSDAFLDPTEFKTGSIYMDTESTQPPPVVRTTTTNSCSSKVGDAVHVEWSVGRNMKNIVFAD